MTTELEDRIIALEKSVRGGNGEKGLVAQLAVLQNTIEILRQEVSDLHREKHEEIVFRQEITSQIRLLDERIQSIKRDIADLREAYAASTSKHPDFKWFVEKIFLPLLLPLLGTLLGIQFWLQNFGGK